MGETAAISYLRPEPEPISDYDVIRFTLKNGMTVDASIDRLSGDLEIRSATGHLAVMPRAANTMQVRVESF